MCTIYVHTYMWYVLRRQLLYQRALGREEQCAVYSSTLWYLHPRSGTSAALHAKSFLLASSKKG